MNRCLIRLFKSLMKHSCAYSNNIKPSEFIIFISESVVLCWHPEQPYPYEFSKSLHIKEKDNFSLLRIGNKEVKEMFHCVNNELIPHELAAKTFTTKHRWYPRARDKKFNKNTPMDRPYL